MSPVPIIDLQRRLTLVGAIRAGGEKPDRGVGRKLDSFRLTSPRRQLVEQAAELYGGTVSPWKSPVGDEFQVYTQAEEIPVLVMPGYSLRQAYELWEGATKRTRLCDGLEEELSGQPCLCNSEGVDRCDLYTRLVVALPELDTVLGWRLISKGINAGHELPTMLALAEARASGSAFVPARLRIDARRGVKDGQVVRYVVPTLDFGLSYQTLAAGNHRAALPPAPDGFEPAPRRDATVDDAFESIAVARDRAPTGRTAPLGPPTPPPLAPAPLPTPDADQPPEKPPLPADPPDEKARRRMHASFREAGIQERGARLAYSVEKIGRQIKSSTELTAAEVTTITNALKAERQPAVDTGPDVPATDAHKRQIFDLMRDAGFAAGDRDAQLAYAIRVIGRPIASSNELTIRETQLLIDDLQEILKLPPDQRGQRLLGVQEQAVLAEGAQPVLSDNPESDRIRALFFGKGIHDNADRRAYCGGVLDREPSNLDELTPEEAATLIAHLEQYDPDDPQTHPFPGGF